eukprot:m.88624 g.88624  ORF g.88624 m.88624 type:complete len:438 (-) comp9767_c0_seq4:51-1364(-)
MAVERGTKRDRGAAVLDAVDAYVSVGWVFALAAALRAGLLVYGMWHDRRHPTLPYTDLDFAVLTRGAALVAAGESPYLCETFRYPPILALMVVPSVWIHPLASKALLCVADLLVGVLIWKLVKGHSLRHPPQAGHAVHRAWPVLAAAMWLFNPLTVAVSTRGNVEAVVATAVLTALYCLQTNRFFVAGMAYGAAVHLKLYPIIYAIPTVLALDDGRAWGGSMRHRLKALLTPSRLWFAVGAATAFGGAGAVSYAAYGWSFVHHSYLYHFTRTDHRHNFSPYFLPMYLAAGVTDNDADVVETLDDKAARYLGIAALVPQAVLVLLAGVTLRHDLSVAWLVQTMVFVMLNKVCTSQYFVWVLCLLPVAAPRIIMTPRRAMGLAALWMGGQVAWLRAAYKLEILGHDSFEDVWTSGVFLLLCHAWCIRAIILACLKVPVP